MVTTLETAIGAGAMIMIGTYLSILPFTFHSYELDL
jgi:hypothetical protein